MRRQAPLDLEARRDLPEHLIIPARWWQRSRGRGAVVEVYQVKRKYGGLAPTHHLLRLKHSLNRIIILPVGHRLGYGRSHDLQLVLAAFVGIDIVELRETSSALDRMGAVEMVRCAV